MRIIYASYGSNILKERFMYYIKGGIYRGYKYKGCQNKKDPISLGYMFIPYKLYFAKASEKWNNGGVAFITPYKIDKEELFTLVRLWEIEEDQFNDIWDQEGKRWYNTKMFLGEENGKKIYTFTGDWEDEINLPSDEYLKVIKKGVREITNWNDNKIKKYLTKFL